MGDDTRVNPANNRRRPATVQRNSSQRLIPGEVNHLGMPMGTSHQFNQPMSKPHDWSSFEKMFPNKPDGTPRNPPAQAANPAAPVAPAPTAEQKRTVANSLGAISNPINPALGMITGANNPRIDAFLASATPKAPAAPAAPAHNTNLSSPDAWRERFGLPSRSESIARTAASAVAAAKMRRGDPVAEQDGSRSMVIAPRFAVPGQSNLGVATFGKPNIATTGRIADETGDVTGAVMAQAARPKAYAAELRESTRQKIAELEGRKVRKATPLPMTPEQLSELNRKRAAWGMPAHQQVASAVPVVARPAPTQSVTPTAAVPQTVAGRAGQVVGGAVKGYATKKLNEGRILGVGAAAVGRGLAGVARDKVARVAAVGGKAIDLTRRAGQGVSEAIQGATNSAPMGLDDWRAQLSQPPRPMKKATKLASNGSQAQVRNAATPY